MTTADGNRQVLNWAHQGGAIEGPSNTIWAMRTAVANGASGLEFDVHLTWDGHLIVAHDQWLGRVSRGWGLLRWKTLDRLKRVDAAYWWVAGKTHDHHADAGKYRLRGKCEQDPSLRLPTAEELLAALDEVAPGRPLTIEVKAFRAAKPMVRLISATGRHNVTMTALWAPMLWRIRQVRKAEGLVQRLGLSPATGYATWFVARALLRVPLISSPYTRLQIPKCFTRPTVVEAAKRAGLAVDVWTVNDEGAMRKMVRRGVQGIITDRPSLLRDVLNDIKARA